MNEEMIGEAIRVMFASLGCTALGILAIFVILTLIRRHKAKKKGESENEKGSIN